MRLAAALGAALLLIAAPASAELAAVSPAQKVTSRDGGLTVSVPRGALKKNTKVRVRLLQRAQYPPELRNAASRPGTKLYALEPAGLRFLKPVTITRRLNAKLAGFDLARGIPGIVLVTRSGNGRWETLTNQSVRRAGDILVLTARTRHFSTIVAFDLAFSLLLTPRTIDARVGDQWRAQVSAEILSRRTRDPVTLESVRWYRNGLGAVSLVADQGRSGATYTCSRAGPGTYGATAVFERYSLAEQILGLQLAREDVEEQEFVVEAAAICRQRTPPPPSPQLQLAFACVVVAHSPLGSDPSFMRWLLQVTGQLPANAQASLTAGGVNGGSPVSQPVNTTTGKVELVGGINSYGQKPVQNLTVGSQNLTQQLVGKVGAAPNVTAAEGTIAGQCPP